MNRSKNKKEQADDDSVRIQRSFYVPLWVWEAADNLPVSRPEIIIQALLNAVSAYKSEIPQLRYDVEQIDKQIESLLALKTAKLERINELEHEEVIHMMEASNSDIAVKQVIEETMSLATMLHRDMGPSHFKRLEKLSGTPAEEIKEFLKSKKFRPDEDEVRMFFMR